MADKGKFLYINSKGKKIYEYDYVYGILNHNKCLSEQVLKVYMGLQYHHAINGGIPKSIYRRAWLAYMKKHKKMMVEFSWGYGKRNGTYYVDIKGKEIKGSRW